MKHVCVYVCFCDFLFPETAGEGGKKKSDALGLNFQMNCRASPPTAAGVFQLFHEECARAGTCLHVCNVRMCDIELLPNSFASGKRFAVIPSRRTFAERGVAVQRRTARHHPTSRGAVSARGRRALTLRPAPVIYYYSHTFTHLSRIHFALALTRPHTHTCARSLKYLPLERAHLQELTHYGSLGLSEEFPRLRTKERHLILFNKPSHNKMWTENWHSLRSILLMLKGPSESGSGLHSQWWEWTRETTKLPTAKARRLLPSEMAKLPVEFFPFWTNWTRQKTKSVNQTHQLRFRDGTQSEIL